jgi:hypothetical protein
MPIRRWKSLGPARRDRVNFALHNDRAMVLPARGRTTSTASSPRYRAEVWRPVQGRFLDETAEMAARRTAQATAVIKPKGKSAQSAHLDRQQRLAVEKEARRIKNERLMAANRAKKAKKTAARARHEQVVAIQKAVRGRTIPAPVPRAAAPTPTPAPVRRPDPLQRVAARPMLDPFLPAPRGDAP